MQCITSFDFLNEITLIQIMEIKKKITSSNVKLVLFNELHWFSHEQLPLQQSLIILYFVVVEKKTEPCDMKRL